MPNKSAEQILSSNTIAIVGLDRNRKKMGWNIFDELNKRGVNLFAINDNGGESYGVPLHKSLQSLPQKPDAVVVAASIKKYPKIMDDLLAARIPDIFFQYGTSDKAALNKLREKGLSPHSGCVLMYLSNTAGIHKFHRFLQELFVKGDK